MYKVIALPGDKFFIDKLYDFRRYDAEAVFGIVYRETKTGKYYGKRTSIGGYIMDKEYQLCPEGCKLELMTPRADAVYILTESTGKGKNTTREINLMEFPVRSPKARGTLIGSKTFVKITHSRYLTEEELAQFTNAPGEQEEMETEAESSAAPVAENVPVSEVEVKETPATVSVPSEVVEPPQKEEKTEIKALPEDPREESSSDTPLLGDVPPDPVEEKGSGKTQKISRKNEDKDADGEDDLGIIQPEFGF